MDGAGVLEDNGQLRRASCSHVFRLRSCQKGAPCESSALTCTGGEGGRGGSLEESTAPDITQVGGVHIMSGSPTCSPERWGWVGLACSSKNHCFFLRNNSTCPMNCCSNRLHSGALKGTILRLCCCRCFRPCLSVYPSLTLSVSVFLSLSVSVSLSVSLAECLGFSISRREEEC